jgi:3-isopropylmalate dehydratase small subunit
MQKFTTLTGIAAHLPMINVDTDMVIPKQYLKTIKRTGLGTGLFAELRYDENGARLPDFVLHKPPYDKAVILITGENFGCGSSREHAPGRCSTSAYAALSRRASPTSSTTTASRTAFCLSPCRRSRSTS